MLISEIFNPALSENKNLSKDSTFVMVSPAKYGAGGSDTLSRNVKGTVYVIDGHFTFSNGFTASVQNRDVNLVTFKGDDETDARRKLVAELKSKASSTFQGIVHMDYYQGHNRIVSPPELIDASKNFFFVPYYGI